MKNDRHGVKQPRNPWSDGPVYITQCPIKPGAISLMKSYCPQRKEPYGGIPIVIALVPLSMVLSLFFLK